MSGERILVVDDEPQIRRALEIALTKYGYAVELAADGESALVSTAAHEPEVLILDLVMPGINGFDLLHDVREFSNVPIIVLSARGRESDKVHALDLGADDYLTKPFGVDELLARVRALLRRKGEASSSVVQFGPVTVDLAARTVRRAGEEVRLTATEYELLRALAANVDKVMTHRQLLERVWGEYAIDNPQQLRVYINYLRRKLEDNPARPQWIVTEPGVGYRLRQHAP